MLRTSHPLPSQCCSTCWSWSSPQRHPGIQARQRGWKPHQDSCRFVLLKPFFTSGFQGADRPAGRPAGLQQPHGTRQSSGGALHPSAPHPHPLVLCSGLLSTPGQCNSTLLAGAKPSPLLPKAWLRSYLLQEVLLDVPSLPSLSCY